MQKINSSKMVLRYSKPASSFSLWENSLPLGNGNVGALVQGGVKYERIMLTDSRANWLGNVGVLPDVSDKMKEVRRLVEAKNQVMAGITIEKAFETKKYTPIKACPFPIADLVVEQTINGKHVTNYVRQLNMDNEEATVAFTDAGTKIDRSCFVSFADDMVYYEISKVGNSSLNFEFSLISHDLKYSAFNGELAPKLENTQYSIVADYMMFDQEYDGMHYGVVARIIADNKAKFQTAENKLRVTDAEKILVILKTYVTKFKEKEWQAIKTTLQNIKQPSYERAFKAHETEFRKNSGKCVLEISSEKDSFVENLIANFNENSTLIYEKLFNFGKYLIICGINDGLDAKFVTGLWSYHYANTSALADSCCNLPALYSASATLGLEEKIKALLDYFTKYSDDLKKNAFRVYKSKGYAIPYYFASGTGVMGSTKAEDVSVVVGGAIIANLYADYFLLTKDMKFLKNEALPFMCEVAKFYMNYFYLNSYGEVVSCPSFSPLGKSKYFENKNVGVYTSCPADFVIVRTLLANIINLSNNYSVSLPEIVEFQKFLNMLPQPKVEKGILCEYSDDENSIKSAGFLQFYPVYGTKDISQQSNLSSIAPYLNSVVQKIDKGLFAQNITSLGRLSQIASILGHGEATLSLLRYMITNFMSQNLMFFNFDKSNLCAYVGGDNFFNIAGNQLLLSAVSDCLVLSSGRNISILPSKPQNWASGKISGVNTELNCMVDISWDDKKGVALVNLKATKATTFNVALFKGVKKVKGYDINLLNPFIENISLTTGKSLMLEIKY